MKRFGGLKVMGLSPSLMFQSPLSLVSDVQSMSSLPCMSAIRELQLSPQMISILESIEPQVVYSGYDNSQPEVPNLLLNSLNRLCERQLLWIVRWSKSLPGNTLRITQTNVSQCDQRLAHAHLFIFSGFCSLHINDQMTLIQYSWMSLMVFSLGWRTFQNVTADYLYFAPDLILSQ